MGTITAKQLKQNTGEIIRRVKAGERLTITYRGKTVALIEPSVDNKNKVKKTDTIENAWDDIENSLNNTEAAFSDWKDAVKWIRNRN